jgi:hypothetical protein
VCSLDIGDAFRRKIEDALIRSFGMIKHEGPVATPAKDAEKDLQPWIFAAIG